MSGPKTLLVMNRSVDEQISFNSYYLGTPEHCPGQQHLFRVSSQPPKFGVSLSRPQCLTCAKTDIEKSMSTTNTPPRLVTSWDDDWEEDPTLPPLTTPLPKRRKARKEVKPKKGPPPCQYFTAIFAPGALGLALIECLGPDVPSTGIYRMPIDYENKPIQPIVHLQNNTRLRERIANTALPQVKSFPVMISGGYHAQVRMFLPPGLREDEITRYPMILHV